MFGYHLIGIEGGVNFGIPFVRKNQFDELSLMLNLDYGYIFEFENLALLSLCENRAVSFCAIQPFVAFWWGRFFA